MAPSATAKLAAVFGAGFISFFAQALVFRRFLEVFEGGELSAGLFFAFWLLWICAGAAACRAAGAFAEKLASFFATSLLAFVPAIALQLLATANARELAGVEAFAVFPFAKLLLWAALASAPVSLLTGALFVAAGLWLKDFEAPAARIYAVEALGSCVGALSSTLLLSAGLGEAACLSVAGAGLSALSLLSLAILERKPSWKLLPSATLLAGLIAASSLGFASLADFRMDARAFHSIAPDGSFKGSFSTRQAKYLYGERRGQAIVVSWGSTVEALPGSEKALEAVATALSQNPKARKILVFGENSLSTCLELSKISGVTEILWLSSDPEYPMALLSAMPGAMPPEATLKIKPVKAEIRKTLLTEKGIDLAVIGSVNYASLASNRFISKEFFESVKASLSDGGIMLLTFPGGENFMGGELSSLGSSIYFTAKSVFDKTLLKPGDESTLICSSEKASPSVDSEELIRRLYTIKELSKEYYPENMARLFDASRISFQSSRYDESFKGSESLNSDAKPSSFMNATLLGATKCGLKLEGAKNWLLLLALLPVFWLACHSIFRVLWLGGRPAKTFAAPNPLDVKIALLGAAAWGMGMELAILFNYQIANGSLFVDFGLLNALFMAGSFLGGAAALAARKIKGLCVVCIGILSFLSFLLLTGFLANPGGLFWLKTFLAGAAGGFIATACAGELSNAGKDARNAAAALESFDCLGAAFGAVVVSIAAIPLFGVETGAICVGILPFLATLPFLESAFREEAPLVEGGYLLKAFAFLLCAATLAALSFALLFAPLAQGLDLALLETIFGAGAALMIALDKIPFERRGGLWARSLAALLFVLLCFAALRPFLPGSSTSPEKAPLPSLKSLDSFQSAAGAAAAPGKEEEDPRGVPRKIDASKLKELAKAGRLSSRKALFWSPVGE